MSRPGAIRPRVVRPDFRLLEIASRARDYRRLAKGGDADPAQAARALEELRAGISSMDGVEPSVLLADLVRLGARDLDGTPVDAVRGLAAMIPTVFGDRGTDRDRAHMAVGLFSEGVGGDAISDSLVHRLYGRWFAMAKTAHPANPALVVRFGPRSEVTGLAVKAAPDTEMQVPHGRGESSIFLAGNLLLTAGLSMIRPITAESRSVAEGLIPGVSTMLLAAGRIQALLPEMKDEKLIPIRVLVRRIKTRDFGLPERQRLTASPPSQRMHKQVRGGLPGWKTIVHERWSGVPGEHDIVTLVPEMGVGGVRYRIDGGHETVERDPFTDGWVLNRGGFIGGRVPLSHELQKLIEYETGPRYGP